MKIINIKNVRTSILKNVAKQLRAGAVIVYPTDTAYALGCDATDAKAVARIFKIKGRPHAKGFPLIVSDIAMAKKFFHLPTSNLPLATRHWPGPLSLVVAAKKTIAKNVLERGTAAVRVPDSALARRLVAALGRPLVATSANFSGQPACYSAKAYIRTLPTLPCPKGGRKNHRPPFGEEGEGGVLPDFVIDGGALRPRKPSTIVRIGRGGTIEVLRPGPIKIVVSNQPPANSH